MLSELRSADAVVDGLDQRVGLARRPRHHVPQGRRRHAEDAKARQADDRHHEARPTLLDDEPRPGQVAVAASVTKGSVVATTSTGRPAKAARRPRRLRRHRAQGAQRPAAPHRRHARRPSRSASKAQFAAMETALSQAQSQQAWLTGQIASLAKSRRSSDLKLPALGPITGRRIRSVPSEVSVATYARLHSAAYQQQSILTAPPGRLVVMLYDGCPALPLPGRRTRCARMIVARLGRALRRARGDHRRAARDARHERGGEIAASLEGIYVFCTRHLIEARFEQDADKIEKVSRAPRRAARGLGSDRRRRPDDRLAAARRARRARARPGARRRWDARGRAQRRSAPATPPRCRSAAAAVAARARAPRRAWKRPARCEALQAAPHGHRARARLAAPRPRRRCAATPAPRRPPRAAGSTTPPRVLTSGSSPRPRQPTISEDAAPRTGRPWSRDGPSIPFFRSYPSRADRHHSACARARHLRRLAAPEALAANLANAEHARLPAGRRRLPRRAAGGARLR